MKKKLIITLLLTLSLSFAGCGRNTEEIVDFQNKLNTVVLKMERLDTKLNTIDPSASDAVDVALDALKELNTAFNELAAIQVTDEEHLYITDLADEGADYMAHAYELFKKAYTKDSFDEDNAALAYQYLERATKRVRVIVTMLHGKIPEGVIIK